MNSSRFYLEKFAADAAQSLPSGTRILDAGAGDCPYMDQFLRRGIIYESSDFCGVEKTYGNLTYSCRVESIPVESERFHLVFLSQVLEHLPEPLTALKELYRVLKPNGTLWLSAPLYYEEHEKPYDYFRYTQFGLRHLLEAANFSVERIDWLEGYSGTLAHQFCQAAVNLSIRPSNYGTGLSALLTTSLIVFLRPLLFAASRRLSTADTVIKITDRGHCKNYCLVARKVDFTK